MDYGDCDANYFVSLLGDTVILSYLIDLVSVVYSHHCFYFSKFSRVSQIYVDFSFVPSGVHVINGIVD